MRRFARWMLHPDQDWLIVLLEPIFVGFLAALGVAIVVVPIVLVLR
jgi:hypothetical protein